MLVGPLKCGPALSHPIGGVGLQSTVQLGHNHKKHGTTVAPCNSGDPLIWPVSDQSPTAQTQGATPAAEFLHLHLRQCRSDLEI